VVPVLTTTKQAWSSLFGLVQCLQLSFPSFLPMSGEDAPIKKKLKFPNIQGKSDGSHI
jgi:hypothetical protein